MLRLPKPHLSNSQVKLWKQSQKRYKEQYFKGIEPYVFKELAFGKNIAELLALDNLFAVPDDLAEVIKLLPRPDYYECPLAMMCNGFYYLGFADGVSKDFTNLYEFKTGKTKWTQSRVEKSTQLTDYAMMIHTYTGKIPDISLFWMETQDTLSGIAFTGKVTKFTTKRTKAHINERKEEITGVAAEISKAYNEFLSKPMLNKL